MAEVHFSEKIQKVKGKRIFCVCNCRNLLKFYKQKCFETSNKEEEGASGGDELILKTGLQHITLKQALNAASNEFKAHMPFFAFTLNVQIQILGQSIHHRHTHAMQTT